MRLALRAPDDEQDWDKLEQLRRAICRAAVDEEAVELLEIEELEALASAIEACDNPRLLGQVGKYPADSAAARRVAHLIPPGSTALPPGARVSKKVTAAAQKKMAAMIRDLGANGDSQ